MRLYFGPIVVERFSTIMRADNCPYASHMTTHEFMGRQPCFESGAIFRPPMKPVNRQMMMYGPEITPTTNSAQRATIQISNQKCYPKSAESSKSIVVHTSFIRITIKFWSSVLLTIPTSPQIPSSTLPRTKNIAGNSGSQSAATRLIRDMKM